MPVGMRVMTNVTAQPPQRMLVAVIVVVMVVFGLCSWGHGQCRGANHPGAHQNLGELLGKDLGRSRQFRGHRFA